MEGEPGFSQASVAVGQDGVQEFPQYVSDSSFASRVGSLNNATRPDSGFMAEQWSSKLHASLSAIDEFKVLEDVSALTSFPNDNGLGNQLKLVSRLQQTAAQRGITRDLYSVGYSSFDHHGGLAGPLDSMFQQVDEALTAYSAELKALGLWDSTVLVEISEFGRTLYPSRL